MKSPAHPTRRKTVLYTALLAFNAVIGAEASHAKYAMEEVVVTATKKASGELAQDVGIAVTAVSGDTIENRFMSDLTDVGNLAPNVQMSAAGTTPGTPSFSLGEWEYSAAFRQMNRRWELFRTAFIWASIRALSPVSLMSNRSRS
jgi:hypothetical protein